MSKITTWYDNIAHHTQGDVLPEAEAFNPSPLTLKEEEFGKVQYVLSQTKQMLENQANQATALNEDYINKQTKLIHLDAQINAHTKKKPRTHTCYC